MVDLLKKGEKIELTLPTHNKKRFNDKELLLETLQWKLRFHEEQIELIKKQIKFVEESD